MYEPKPLVFSSDSHVPSPTSRRNEPSALVFDIPAAHPAPTSKPEGGLFTREAAASSSQSNTGPGALDFTSVPTAAKTTRDAPHVLFEAGPPQSARMRLAEALVREEQGWSSSELEQIGRHLAQLLQLDPRMLGQWGNGALHAQAERAERFSLLFRQISAAQFNERLEELAHPRPSGFSMRKALARMMATAEPVLDAKTQLQQCNSLLPGLLLQAQQLRDEAQTAERRLAMLCSAISAVARVCTGKLSEDLEDSLNRRHELLFSAKTQAQLLRKSIEKLHAQCKAWAHELEQIQLVLLPAQTLSDSRY